MSYDKKLTNIYAPVLLKLINLLQKSDKSHIGINFSICLINSVIHECTCKILNIQCRPYNLHWTKHLQLKPFLCIIIRLNLYDSGYIMHIRDAQTSWYEEIIQR